ALTKRLRELRDRTAKREMEPESAHAAQKTLSGPRRIYLHAGSGAEAARTEIGHVLTEDGIVPLTAQKTGSAGLADWQRGNKMRMEGAKRCEALALLRTEADADADNRFIGDLLDVGVDERDRVAEARGAPLPCAILDKTGSSLPIDVSSFG